MPESSKVRVLIVEDELIVAESISEMLISLDYEVVDTCIRAKTALKVLETEEVDIAILDIKLKGEESGIWLGKKILENHGIPFIYLTSHGDQRTINEAGQTLPHGYLLKPVGKNNLFASIESALSKYSEESKIDGDESNSGVNAVIKEALFVKDEYQYVKVKFDELRFIKASGNYIEIHTSKEKRLIKGTLKSIESCLPKDVFFSPHRSFLVNIGKIDVIGNNYLLIDKDQIPLVKESRKVLEKMISAYN